MATTNTTLRRQVVELRAELSKVKQLTAEAFEMHEADMERLQAKMREQKAEHEAECAALIVAHRKRESHLRSRLEAFEHDEQVTSQAGHERARFNYPRPTLLEWAGSFLGGRVS